MRKEQLGEMVEVPRHLRILTGFMSVLELLISQEVVPKIPVIS